MNKQMIVMIAVFSVVAAIVYAANPTFVNIANNHLFNATEDSEFSFFIEGNDTDAEFPLNFSDTSEDVMSVFNMSNFNDTHALINFTATNDDVGGYEFFVVVEDTNDDFTTIRIKFNVSNVNDPPNITLLLCVTL